MTLYDELHKLMINAIEEKRDEKIEDVCLDIWNQPFFYKIDKSKALTISYAPTDKGARTNYPHLLKRYRENPLSSEEIFNLLYDFMPEPHWRRNYNIIFKELGIKGDMIAHMDMSSFPFLDDRYRQIYRGLDSSYKYPLEAVALLSDQIEYILIDGKDNKEIFDKYFSEDYDLYDTVNLPINKSERLYELSIYKHKTKNITLIYYGCFLWGETRPNKEYVLNLAKYIKETIK